MLESTFLEDWDGIGTKMAKKAICCLKVALILSLSVVKGLKQEQNWAVHTSKIRITAFRLLPIEDPLANTFFCRTDY